MSIPGTGIYNRTYAKKPPVASVYTASSQQNSNINASPRISGRALGKGLAYLLAAMLIYFVISAVGHLL
jgi:hypothetical protein